MKQLESWQENLIFESIKKIKNNSETYAWPSWRSLDTINAYIDSLMILDYISGDEYKELTDLTRGWAVKWHK